MLARRIRLEIKNETALTASAGVGPSKFIAKVASAMGKPDGLLVVCPEEVEAFVAGLPVRRFWGVGAVTAARLQEAGYDTGRDLREAGEQTLRQLLGRFGGFLYRLACGVDPRSVQPTRKRKSVGRQRSFIPNLQGIDACQEALSEISSDVARRMGSHRLAARRVTLRVRNNQFVTVTRQTTSATPVWKPEDIQATAALLLCVNRALLDHPIRLLGVSLSGLIDRDQIEGLQLRLDLRPPHIPNEARSIPDTKGHGHQMA